MQYIGYIFFRLLVVSFYLIPFPILYLYSDMLRFVLYNLIGYRKEVVYKNLKISFPDKTDEEIKALSKKFYRNLSDVTLESIKGLSMSKKALLKRFPVKNIEILDEYYENGQSIIGLASHYSNWEWGVISFGLQFRHTSIGLYKLLSNKYTDRYVRRARAAYGMILVSIYDSAENFQKDHEKPVIYFMISDQSPSNIEKAIWVHFLNQDTACLHGAEGYAKKYNLPLVYGDIQRIKRGYYEVYMTKTIEKPNETEDGEITQAYMKKLESIIHAKPENWLWSHKRWKHKRTT